MAATFRPFVTRTLGAGRARAMSAVPSYTERMASTGRPVSPDITIYAFPTIAYSSIAVRVTGMLLTAGEPPLGRAFAAAWLEA